jgi:hypothetical protein
VNLFEPKKVTDSAEGVILRLKAYNVKHSIGAVCEAMDVIYVQSRFISSFGVQGGMMNRWRLLESGCG